MSRRPRGARAWSRRALVLMLSAALLVPASAQTQDTPPAPPVANAGAAAEPPSPAGRAYRAAFELMLEGRFAEAIPALEAFLRDHPLDDHAPTAEALLVLAQRYASAPGMAGVGDVRGALDDQGGGASSAIELVTTLTLFGIWTGVAFSLVVDDPQSALLTAAIGGLLGVGGGLLHAWDQPITSGQATLTSSALLWGTWNGVALQMAVDDNFIDNDPQLFFGVTWLASALSIGGALTVGALHPEIKAGDVSLASSGALWGTFTAGMILLIAEADLNKDSVYSALVAGTDVGLAAMAITAAYVDVSRGRMALIDLGGLLGGLLAGGFVAIGVPDSGAAVGLPLLGGAAVGIGLTAWLTSGSDDDDAGDASAWYEPRLFITPRVSGGQRDVAVGAHLINLEL